MDLNDQYQTFVNQLFPNAQILFDHFYIVQLAGRALDFEFLQALKGMSDHHDRTYKVLKSNWHLFHQDENQISASKNKYYRGLNEFMPAQNVVDLGLDAFPRFKQVYHDYQTILSFIRNRERAALQQLVMNYLGVGNVCLYGYSNEPLEEVIRKIKELKRSCYGFNNLSHFFIRIKLIHA